VRHVRSGDLDMLRGAVDVDADELTRGIEDRTKHIVLDRSVIVQPVSKGREMLVEGGIEQGSFEDRLADVVERDAPDEPALVSDDQTGA